jgi:alkylhydroperoxidase family enzyme
MARLRYISSAELAESERHLLDRPINLFRALAHNPEVLAQMSAVGSWIRYWCTLDPRLRELAILQVGYSAGSEYEFSHHVRIGMDFGVAEADVEALIAESKGQDSGLDERARCVLAAARELTVGVHLRDETWSSLSRHFDPPHLVGLLFVITHYIQVTRLLGALQIDVENEYQPYLEKFLSP